MWWVGVRIPLSLLRNWKCLLKGGDIDNVPNQAGILESFAEKP